MRLGRVIGTVVASALVDELSATPFLCVQPLDREGQDEGKPLVCADGTRMAGPGQVIYWVANREAALALDPWFVPVDDAIVGLVDEVRNYPPEDLDLMIFARITGSVVSTIHHSIVDGRRLLLAERLDIDGKATGGYVIAMDVVGAGMGETVLVLDEGNGARQVLDDADAPIRSVVVAIVDEVKLGSD